MFAKWLLSLEKPDMRLVFEKAKLASRLNLIGQRQAPEQLFGVLGSKAREARPKPNIVIFCRCTGYLMT